MKHLSPLFLVVLILVGWQLTKKPTNEHVISSIKIVTTKKCEVIPAPTEFTVAIEHLKKYEGFRSEPYRDVDGTWTIGYGHHMIEGWWKDSISEISADSLLRCDLNKELNLVKQRYGYEGDRALAISLFIFNCGLGNYERSTLKKLVDKNLPIDDEIVKWCHFVKANKTVTSSKLLERRQFELKIYNHELVAI